MALSDYIGIVGLDGPEPFQGIAGGTFTLASDTGGSSGPGDATSTDSDLDTDSGTDTNESLTELFKQAFLKPAPPGDGDDAGGNGGDDDTDVPLISILDQRLGDLAFVDTTVDFGAFRAHLKGKMIEYGGS
jgi:hypothetical protein